MTLTLELPPATEQGLENGARRRGVAIEKFVLDVLEREAEVDAQRVVQIKARNAAFLRLLEETAPDIEPATRHLTSDDVTRAIHDSREERTLEILATSGIIVEPEQYDASAGQ